MPKYQCPECEAVLRRAEAVAPGKKIRCPKCEAVFAAKEIADDEKEPAQAASYAVAGAPPAPPPKPNIMEEEEDANPYKVIKEDPNEARPEIHLGSLRDRFAKSTIGPAMYRTVICSNWLLRQGLFTCVFAVFVFIYGVFPIIFCEAMPIRPLIRPRVTIMLIASLNFSFGSIMCMGASKMHDLTSYAWAIIGSLMSLAIYIPTGIILAIMFLVMFGPIGLVIAIIIGLFSCCGFWCLIVLMNKAVREGFRERAEEINI